MLLSVKKIKLEKPLQNSFSYSGSNLSYCRFATILKYLLTGSCTGCRAAVLNSSIVILFCALVIVLAKQSMYHK
jgi:hypothetical protein